MSRASLSSQLADRLQELQELGDLHLIQQIQGGELGGQGGWRGGYDDAEQTPINSANTAIQP